MLVTPEEFLEKAKGINANNDVIFTIVNDIINSSYSSEDLEEGKMEFPKPESILHNQDLFVLCSPTDHTFSVISVSKLKQNKEIEVPHQGDFYTPLFQVLKQLAH
jgi:hypothetical protein